jgi:hypothetical protein
MPHRDPFMLVERYIQRMLSRFPAPISRFLGYRDQKLPPSPTWVICVWGFIGAFGGLSVLFAVFGHTDYFTGRNVPALVASYVKFSSSCFCIITHIRRERPQFFAMEPSTFH